LRRNLIRKSEFTVSKKKIFLNTLFFILDKKVIAALKWGKPEMAWKNHLPEIWGRREKRGFLGEISRP